jgi:hypothetical protein
MDANGARELSKRLEAQEHWRQAATVQNGEQSAADPDAHALEELGEGFRRYKAESGESSVLCKRLVDGRWETSYEPEPAPVADDAASQKRSEGPQ